MDNDSVAYYVERLSFSEDAFDYLRSETDESNLPTLMSAFCAETNTSARLYLIEIIYHHHTPTSLDFLANVLQHPDSRYWQIALDGIVSFATTSALNVLRDEHNRLITSSLKDASTRLAYIDEGIDQITEALSEQDQR